MLRGGFSEVVGGFGMRFVGVAQVRCVAEEGLAEFDDRVVGMVLSQRVLLNLRGWTRGVAMWWLLAAGVVRG